MGKFFKNINKLFKKSPSKVEIARDSNQIEDDASLQPKSEFIKAHKRHFVYPIESMSFEDMCFFGGFPVLIYTAETVFFEDVDAQGPALSSNVESIILSPAKVTKDTILPFSTATPEYKEYEVVELESRAYKPTASIHSEASTLELSQLLKLNQSLSEISASAFNVSGNTALKSTDEKIDNAVVNASESVGTSLHANSGMALGVSSCDTLIFFASSAFGISSTTSLNACLYCSFISIPSFAESTVFFEQNELATVNLIDYYFEQALALHQEIEWKTNLFERTKDVFFLHNAQKLREKHAALLKIFFP